MSLVNFEWFKVVPTNPLNVPPPRAMSMATPHGPQQGLKQMVMLVGGAHFECLKDTPPCVSPQPMNDVWWADVAPPETSTTNKMADFDGDNDVLQVDLPEWCADVESLSVLWLDAWMYPLSRGIGKTIIYDIYQSVSGVESSVLRLYIEGKKSGSYIRLVLQPGASQVLIKEWGPLEDTFFGFWHHITLTLRFARTFSSTSSKPAAVITQAFLFIDKEPLISSGNGDDFLSINIASSLKIKNGFDYIMVGGPDPEIPDAGYSNFRGGLDNFRVWWPSCPDVEDPSRCNPYGFLYPKYNDGSRAPWTGINDKEVTMEHVAGPVAQFMYSDTVSGARSEGLLIHYDFDGSIINGIVPDVATEYSTDICENTWDKTKGFCPGCEPTCVFAQCAEFDVECVVNSIDNKFIVSEVYAKTGECNCRNVKDCPTHTKLCNCPGSLKRKCTACLVSTYVDVEDNQTKACLNGEAKLDYSVDPLNPTKMNPLSLPLCEDMLILQGPGQKLTEYTAEFCGDISDDYCEAWGCGCWDPADTSENAGDRDSVFTVNQVAGTGSCSGTCSDAAMSIQTGGKEKTQGQPPNEVTVTVYPCCPGVKRCLAWTGKTCTGTYINNNVYNGDPNSYPTVDCGIPSCCAEPLVEITPNNNDGPPEETATSNGPSISCSVTYTDAGQITMTCTVDGDGDAATYEGTFDGASDTGGDTSGDTGGDTASNAGGDAGGGGARRRFPGHDGSSAKLQLSLDQFVNLRLTPVDKSRASPAPLAKGSNSATKAATKGSKLLATKGSKPAGNAAAPPAPPSTSLDEETPTKTKKTSPYSKARLARDERERLRMEAVSRDSQQAAAQIVDSPTSRKLLAENSSNGTRQAHSAGDLDTSTFLSWVKFAVVFTKPTDWTWEDSLAIVDLEWVDGSATVEEHDAFEDQIYLAGGQTQPPNPENFGDVLRKLTACKCGAATCSLEAPFNGPFGKDACVAQVVDSTTMVINPVGEDKLKIDFALGVGSTYAKALKDDVIAAKNDILDNIKARFDFDNLERYPDCGNDPNKDSQDCCAENNNECGDNPDPPNCGGEGTCDNTNSRKCCNTVRADVVITMPDAAIQWGGAECGDGVRNEVKDEDGVVTLYEICDLGTLLNGARGSCSDICECNTGFVEGDSWDAYADGNDTDVAYASVNSICECDHPAEFVPLTVETSTVSGGNNTITVSLTISEDISGLELIAPEPKMIRIDSQWIDKSQAKTVVTISGLTGTQTPSGELDLECGGIDGCAVGLLEGEGWNLGRGTWTQDTGTLTFTVLSEIKIERAGPNADQDKVLTVAFTVVNRAIAQTAVHPTVSLCRVSSTLGDGAEDPILSSNQQVMNAAGTYSLARASSSGGAAISIGSITVEDGDLGSATVSVSVTDAVAGRGGVTAAMLAGGLPKSSTLSGIQNTLLALTKTGTLDSPITLSFNVDSGNLAEQGGCFLTEDKRLEVCLGGYVGIYKFDVSSSHWQYQTEISAKSREKTVVTVNTSEFSYWAAVSTTPCCDYEGGGKSCGDKVCMPEEAKAKDSGSNSGLMGSGTISKMPISTFSHKPAITNQAQMDAYKNAENSEARFMTLRRDWTQMCPPKVDGVSQCGQVASKAVGWMPARFGHAMQAVSETKIIIYGGTACNSYHNVTGLCISLTTHDDLWELDITQGFLGKNPFTELDISPRHMGLSGMTSIALSGSSHLVFVLGGDVAPFGFELLAGRELDPSLRTFEFRSMEFRARSSTAVSLATQSAVSHHSAVSNSSVAILFGGFVRNMLTSATYIYDLAAASPELGLSVIKSLASGPESRAYHNIIKPDASTILMFGGTTSQEGFSDLWKLDLNTQAWTEVHKSDIKDGPLGVSMAAGASLPAAIGVYVMVTGGIKKGYVPGVTFNAGMKQGPPPFIETDGYLATTHGFAWDSTSLDDADLKKFWWRVRPDAPDACCLAAEVSAACPHADLLGKGCWMAPRAMHSAQSGTFSAGKSSIVFYGGVDARGIALDDMWYLDTEVFGYGIEYSFRVSNANSSILTKESMEAMFGDRGENLVFVNRIIDEVPDNSVVVQYSVFYNTNDVEAPGYNSYITLHPANLVEMWNANASRIFNGTALADRVAPPFPQGQPVVYTGTRGAKDLMFSNSAFNSADSCRTGGTDKCLRGHCQASATGGLFGTGATNSFQEKVYCYQTTPSHGADSENPACDTSDPSCTTTPYSCPTGYGCSLPGKLHGHATVNLALGGQTPVLMIYGGERSNIDAATADLSSDLYAAQFTPTTGVWAKIPQGDSSGQTCVRNQDNPEGSTCPIARRDAAIALMDNKGSSNGKLLLFGGVTGLGSSFGSPLLKYLKRRTACCRSTTSGTWTLRGSQRSA